MFTPEDEIDELHHELGRWRRRLNDAERARYDGRGCDFAELDRTIGRCRFQIARLERELAGALEAERAADEAYERTLL